jgi:hypothetical protein
MCQCRDERMISATNHGLPLAIQKFVFQKPLNFRVSHGTGTNRIIAVEYHREPVTYIGSVYRAGSL